MERCLFCMCVLNVFFNVYVCLGRGLEINFQFKRKIISFFLSIDFTISSNLFLSTYHASSRSLPKS